MKNWILVALAGVLTITITAFAFAQSSGTANVEVRVWEDVNDPLRNYISARPEGGSWRTLGTIPLPLDDGISSSGRFRYGDITLAVPLPDAAPGQPMPDPGEASAADIEISNLRCESWRVGRYSSDHDRALRGTIRNISNVPLSSIRIYGTLFRGGVGIEADYSWDSDVLIPESGRNFEVLFSNDQGDECRLWQVTYGKTIPNPATTEQDDLRISNITCGEFDTFGHESVHLTMTNTSDAIIGGIDLTASVYGESSRDVDSGSNSGSPVLAPGDETVITIYFDDFEGEARRCALDTLTYGKRISYDETIPYAVQGR